MARGLLKLSRIRAYFGAKIRIQEKMFQPSGLVCNKLHDKLIKAEWLTKKVSGSLQRVYGGLQAFDGGF
ncbi:MAG: hypothetical protein KBH23_05620 [Bacteroidaceae bacterium]|nr:hypothetical protein [Bacteroidaceae bacterium]